MLLVMKVRTSIYSKPVTVVTVRHLFRYCYPKPDCYVAIEFQGHRVIGKCVDYSELGFGAIVEHDLPMGWIMTILLPVAGRQRLRLQARPIYRNASRYGFELLFPDDNKGARVMDFFRKSLERDY